MTDRAQGTDKQMWIEPRASQIWVDPEILELNISDTFAFPGLGADVGGNAFPDCQRS